jgi:hypothetical protein
VTRYKLSRVQTEWYPPMVDTPEWPYGRDPYLAIYEVDRSIEPAALFEVIHANDRLRQSNAPEHDPIAWGEQWFFEAYAGRETPFALPPESPAPPDRDLHPQSIWLVPTTPISDEIENEYHKWYSFQSVLRNDGFESVARYKLSRVQGTIDARAAPPQGEWPFGRHTFLAVWEVSNVLRAYNSRRRPRELPRGQATGGPRYPWMAVWPSLHKADEHLFYEPITRRIISPWLELR